MNKHYYVHVLFQPKFRNSRWYIHHNAFVIIIIILSLWCCDMCKSIYNTCVKISSIQCIVLVYFSSYKGLCLIQTVENIKHFFIYHLMLPNSVMVHLHRFCIKYRNICREDFPTYICKKKVRKPWFLSLITNKMWSD